MYFLGWTNIRRYLGRRKYQLWRCRICFEMSRILRLVLFKIPDAAPSPLCWHDTDIIYERKRKVICEHKSLGSNNIFPRSFITIRTRVLPPPEVFLGTCTPVNLTYLLTSFHFGFLFDGNLYFLTGPQSSSRQNGSRAEKVRVQVWGGKRLIEAC